MDPVQFEISELRRLLAEEQSQSVARKKGLALAISTINDLLSDFKKIGEEIDLLKADRVVKETHSLAYYEVQKKGFNEQLDALTAKLVEKEEALAISERHLASLQEALRLQNVEKKEASEHIWNFNLEEFFKVFFALPKAKSIDSFQSLKEQVQGLSNQLVVKEEQLQAYDKEISSLKSEVEKLKAIADTVTVFEEQANIYKDDFEAERKSREKLNAEKERLLEDFHHLQLRNVKLIDDLRKVQNGEHLPTAPPANVNNRQERSLSPAPPRLNSEPGQTPIFHEKQQGNLCAQHCLNALLQGAHFNAVDLAELAQEMDFAEKTKLAEAGTNSKDYKKFLEQPSENMDDTGYFSIQVIGCALDLWGLEMVPYNSTEMRAVKVRANPTEAKAFICNSHLHWFTIRRLGNHWFNLDSTLEKPGFIPSDHLDDYLRQLQHEENSVFIVFGDLPPCPAEESGELINSLEPYVSRICGKRKFTSKENNQPVMKFHLSLNQNCISSYSPQDFLKRLLFFNGQFTNSMYIRICCFLFKNNKMFKPRQRQFFCPNSNCNQPFSNFEDLHEHVIECWGLQD